MSLKEFFARTWQWLRTNVKTHVVVTLLVFLATFSAFVYYWHGVRNGVQKDEHSAYERQVRILSTATETHLQLYESFLRGGAGLFTINRSLTQADWAQYFQPYNIPKQSPDIIGIGFVPYLTNAEVPAFLNNIRAQVPKYAIWPAGTRNVYAPVAYVATFTANTGKVVGFDGYTTAVRRAAMQASVMSGQPTMSGKITLVSAQVPDKSAFNLYLPVYRNGRPVQTATERQRALYGFVYVAVDIKAMVNALLAENPNSNFALQWYETAGNPKSAPVYQSGNFTSTAKQHGAITQAFPFTLYGHKWKVVLAASPGIISANERQLPALVLWRGFFVSAVLAGAVWLLTTSRERKLSRQKQLEVQDAKDDLLSLASHQLRTPATVVKQYVGMMLQGYGGKITRKQTGMLQNAYDSNERQLEVINQLLYVARLDAGRIALHKQKVDVGKLLQEACDEQAVEAKQRRQKLACKVPKRPLKVEADPQYFRMALDNLINNAIKYTPDKGSITASVRKLEGDALITITDTGIGIDEARQATIFEKFTRLEDELSSNVSGSGIGLYLTNQIVSLHGAHIEVTSSRSHGSSFTIRLPADPNIDLGRTSAYTKRRRPVN
ncbi:MAG TPA: CHASE domain-containing protein [Candidatus Saccharimonadales bacterium]|jgi:signal transduction histidine kinase